MITSSLIDSTSHLFVLALDWPPSSCPFLWLIDYEARTTYPINITQTEILGQVFHCEDGFVILICASIPLSYRNPVIDTKKAMLLNNFMEKVLNAGNLVEPLVLFNESECYSLLLLKREKWIITAFEMKNKSTLEQDWCKRYM